MSIDFDDDDYRHDHPGSGELAGGLASLRVQAGLPATEDEALRVKCVKTKLPIHDVVRKVVSYMATGEYGLYLRGREIGTIDELTGEWKVMTPGRLRTWLPMQCGIMPVEGFEKRKNDKTDVVEWIPLYGELQLLQASSILESDDLKDRLPVVEHIHKVKLPVFRKALDDGINPLTGEPDERRKGFRKMELLKQGYDRESKTFTLRGSLDYDEDWDEEKSRMHLLKILRYFPWAENRSLAVQFAAMLTLYAARLFGGRSPMFMWNANLPGSGKSRLAQFCVHAVHGSAARAGFSYEDKNEVRKELDACAQAFGPYVFFDDLQRGKVRNEHLHRWLTAPDWSCRIMGTKELFHGPLYAATLMTGNQLKLNDDLERRTLVIDLFSQTTARERVLPADVLMLDEDFFADDQARSEVLSALWGLVQWWDRLGRPPTKEKLLDSFESWSRVIPAIVAASSLGNALAPFEATDAGNVEGREMETLMKAVFRELVTPRPADLPADQDQIITVPLQAVVGVARRNKLFQDKLWTVDAVLETEGDRNGFKYKKPGGVDADVPFGEEGDEPVSKGPDPLRTRQAESWMNHSMRSWFGKYFKGQAASGRFWKAESGDVFEVGSRATNDLSKVVMRRKASIPGMVNLK